MGLFDSVYADCPHCGAPVEFQTKADDAPCMNRFMANDAPTHLLQDVLNRPHYCGSCRNWMVLLDARYPIVPPRPIPKAAKVKPPADPIVHGDGYKMWPWARAFTEDDLDTDPG